MSQSKPARVPLSEWAAHLPGRLAPCEPHLPLKSSDYLGALVRDLTVDVFEAGPTPWPTPDGICGLEVPEGVIRSLAPEFVRVARTATYPVALRVRAVLGLSACVALRAAIPGADAEMERDRLKSVNEWTADGIDRSIVDAVFPNLRTVLVEAVASSWLPTGAAAVTRQALAGLDHGGGAVGAFVRECGAELDRTWIAERETALPAPNGTSQPVPKRRAFHLAVDPIAPAFLLLNDKRLSAVTGGKKVFAKQSNGEGKILLCLWLHGERPSTHDSCRTHVKDMLADYGIGLLGEGPKIHLDKGEDSLSLDPALREWALGQKWCRYPLTS